MKINRLCREETTGSLIAIRGSQAKRRCPSAFAGLRRVLAGLAVALVLTGLSAFAQTAAIWDTFDFDTWTEGWKPSSNPDWQGITNVSLTTNFVEEIRGPYQLRMDCDLNNGDSSKTQGLALVDLQEFSPYDVPVPMNLLDRNCPYEFELPAGSIGTDLSATNSFIQIFVMDTQGRGHYASRITLRTNAVHVWGGFIPNTNAQSGGSVDAGFDATQIRYFGFRVGFDPASTGICRGSVYTDALRLWARPGLFTVPQNQKYSFDSGTQGFVVDTYWDNQACTNLVQISSGPSNRTGCLAVDVRLDPATTNFDAGQVYVDMLTDPPPGLSSPLDLKGKRVSAKVFCPAGLGSPPDYQFGLQMFCKDANWNSFYGSWQTLAPYTTGAWFTVSMTPDTNTPSQGYRDANFNPSQVRILGFKVATSGGGASSYTGKMYLDGFSFEQPNDPPPPLETEHLYGYETASQSAWWKWGTNPDGWEAQAWTNVYYATNQGVNGSVALAAQASFSTNSEAARKGVFEIAYQPALNLSTKDHRQIQAKLRFVPSLPAFNASINVFDKLTDQWYKKDFSVGGSAWNTLTFDLDLTNEYTGGSPVPMNTEDIGFITIQIYASTGWNGTIYLDDVVVGGRETRTHYNLITSGFVKPEGHKFVLDGTNFYHCGANIEYLQTVPDRTVRECLDWASSNHIQVVRTWAMQEGKPYSFQPERGIWNEVMFEHLDRVVAEAGHRNIRLMLDVLDNWAHNGGVFQYMHWIYKEHPETVTTNLSKEGVLYHDQFWTNTYAKQWYRDYVSLLLNRTNTITGRVYKEDPTIFAVEIVNEPRCESDFTGRTIHNWLHEMSDWVRSIDTNHILGNGEEGGYVNTYDFADTIPWEEYPDNYYHYGTYGVGLPYCDLYGCGRGHGVDFISDNRNDGGLVYWQGGFYTNQESPSSEWRPGNSNVNFCTARIYIDQKEYNVWRTDKLGADQRLEWINDHWYDATRVINKPMILEEFGIHAIGWVFNGSYGQVQLKRTPEFTLQDRVDIYDLFYDHIDKSGISGSFFWNFGYEGMWDDPFHLGEVVTPWAADSGDGSAVSVSLSTNHVLQAEHSLKMTWNNTNGSNKAIFNCPTNEKWVLRVDSTLTNDPPTHGINRTKFIWNIYNPTPTVLNAALAINGCPSWTWAESATKPLTQGWNKLIFDLSAGTWAWSGSGWQHDAYLIDIPNSVSNVLEDVKQVSLLMYGLPAGAGEVYVDNVQIKRDDGFVVYADDPVCAVIKAHADVMAAKNVATNNPANAAPVASNATVVVDPLNPSPVALGSYDANGNPLSFRIIDRPQHGWIFGTPPNMTYTPQMGYEGVDSFTFVAHDGMVDSPAGTVTVVRAGFHDLRYDFETGVQGWYANQNVGLGLAVTGVAQTADMAIHGAAALKAWVKLDGTASNYAGDAEVNMEYDPPAYVAAPVNLKEQPLRISVFCPTGSRGSGANPNRIQIYAKDTSWRAEYIAETDIVENQWITYTLTVSTNTPPSGWTDDGFDPAQIRALGVRIHYGGSGSEYTGPIYIDAAAFPVLGDSVYNFDSTSQGWTTEDWGNGHATISWTNAIGNPDTGAIWVSPAAGSGYGKFYIKDYDVVDNLDLLYNRRLQAYIWVPADAPVNYHHAVRVRLYIRSDADGWSYDNKSEEFVLAPGTWNLLSWDLSDVDPLVLQNADEFAFEIMWPNRDVWAGAIAIDSIRVPDTRPAPPTYAPNGGVYTNSVSVALSSTVPGSAIHYTTDGSAPTTNSASVVSGGSIVLSQPYSNSVRALAVMAGQPASPVSISPLFMVVAPPAAAPTYNPNGGTFTNSVNVTLSSSTPGATIHYTTNGTAPTTNSPYVASGGSIALTQPYSGAVRAFAKAAGYQNSAVSTSLAFSVVSGATYYTTNTVLDLCQTAAFTNNNGTTNWSGAWTEIGEADGAAAGYVRVGIADLSSNRMRIAYINRGARRQADLSGCVTAVFSFIYRRVALDNTNDYVAVSVSSNGGTSWVELDRFKGSGTDAAYRATNYNITAYASTNTQIRFQSSSALGTADYVYFDDIKITFTKISGPPVNQAPGVNAGSDQQIVLPDNDVNLDGTVSDDGLPNPPGVTTTQWTKISGVGTVTFGNAAAVDTTAGFSTSGVYVLRLTAYDGALSAYDEASITVLPQGTLFTNTVLDMCQTAAFTNNNGTVNWSGAWTEIGETDGAAAGYVRVGIADLSSNRMRIAYINRGARRQANISGCATAVLSFIYRRAALDNTNDYVAVSVSSNGGTSWVELDRFKGSGTDAAYRATNYNITAYASTNTQVRFQSSSALGTADYVYFDDIQILFKSTQAGGGGGAKASLPAGKLVKGSGAASPAQVSGGTVLAVLDEDDFNDGVGDGWTVAPDESVAWSMDDDGTLRADVVGAGGYSFVMRDDLDVAGLQSLAVEYDVLFEDGAAEGGFIYRGRVLYVNPTVVGWADDALELAIGEDLLAAGEWHRVVVRVHAEGKELLTDLVVDDEPVLVDEPIDAKALPLDGVGFLSPYFPGRVKWDNFRVTGW